MTIAHDDNFVAVDRVHSVDIINDHCKSFEIQIEVYSRDVAKKA